jgi:hypothetical protein
LPDSDFVVICCQWTRETTRRDQATVPASRVAMLLSSTRRSKQPAHSRNRSMAEPRLDCPSAVRIQPPFSAPLPLALSPRPRIDKQPSLQDSFAVKET